MKHVASLLAIYISLCMQATYVTKVLVYSCFSLGRFSLSQMQVNVQVQMQGGVGDSCIFRRIGIWNGLFFVLLLLLVWRMEIFSVGIRYFSDI